MLLASKFFVLSSQKEKVKKGPKMFGDKEVISKNLSLFSKERAEADKAVPLIKPWFNNLTVQERVQALSTVDADVTRCIKAAHCKWRNQENASTLKFRLKTNKAELMTQV